ncbi:MOS1T transposase, partial [Pseudoatta argentina]
FCVNKQYLREVLIFCFNWKKSAAEAHRMFVEVYGDTAPTDGSLLQNLIASKDESFFRDGFRKLPEKWEKVVASDIQYFN